MIYRGLIIAILVNIKETGDSFRILKRKVNCMVINNKTGDIILDKNMTLKAQMSIEEIMTSEIMKFVTEEGIEELQDGEGTALKVANVHGHTVCMSIETYEGKVSAVYITLQDYYDFYDKSCGQEKEYDIVINKHRQFLEKVLQIDNVPDEIRYNWGRIELRTDYRYMEHLEIILHYRRGI